MSESDTGYAPEKWAFDHEVTRVFDDMLARSIPQYETMRRAVFDLACRFQQEHLAFVDLGCSRGEAIAGLIDKFGAHNQFVGVEVSAPMVEAARQRFAGLIACGVVDIRSADLREDYPPFTACVTLSVLTMMFIPINYRQALMDQVYKHTAPGGAFILVEKLLGESAPIDVVFVDRYHALKKDNGYSQDDIERKKLALEGVLVPVTASWNEELLRKAGFRRVDCFWRWMNFGGWLAVKD